MTKKRKEIETLIYSTFDILDKTGMNTAKYKKLFGGMDDKTFESHMKKFLNDESENFFLEIIPFEVEPKIEDIKKAADSLNIPLEEYVFFPHLNEEGEPLRTKDKTLVGYLHLKRVQQILSKKNKGSTSIRKRNMKTNQVVGDDKGSRISDVETFALTAINGDEILKEFMGARADDDVAKQEMFKRIYQDGFVSLKDIPSNVENKPALNYLDILFTGAGIVTDLVTPSLHLKSTLKEKQERESLKNKYQD